LKSLDNAITPLKQIDEVLDILQAKKEYTNADLVAMVLDRAGAQMEKIADVLELTEKEILSKQYDMLPKEEIIDQFESYVRLLWYVETYGKG